MEDELGCILRRSKILTNYGLKIRISMPSLPLINNSLQKFSPQTKNLSHLSTKGRAQLQKEARSKQLALLKINFDKNRKNKSQYTKQQIPQKNIQAESFASNIQKQLTNLMSLPLKSNQDNDREEVDQDKEEFIHRCEKIALVHDLVASQKNMRYENKILSIISNMKSKQALFQLFQALRLHHQNYSNLYLRFQKQFLFSDGIFRKNLKSLSLHSEYLIDNYRKNRYRFLNDDIQRIKCQMKEQGGKIGQRLKQIDSLNIRNGIFRSLKSIDLGCLANRGFYNQLTQRRRNSYF